MTTDRDEKLAARAYAIWEREGRPEGRHDEHWAQAAREIDVELAKLGQTEKPRVTTADDPTRGTSVGGATGFSGTQTGTAPAGAGAATRPAGGKR